MPRGSALSRPAALAFVGLLIAAVSAAAADPIAVSFATPAQLRGHVEADGLEWALVYMDGPSTLRLAGVEGGTVQNKTFSTTALYAPDVGGVEVPAGWQPAGPRPLATPFSADLAFAPDRPTSLFIQADSITLAGGPFQGQIVVTSPGDDADTPLPTRPSGSAVHDRPLSAAGVGLGLAAEGGIFRLTADGIRRAEWFGAEVSCHGEGECPAGGGKWSESAGSPRGDSLTVARLSWMDLGADGGRATVEGSALALAAGGASPDALVRGDVRLPGATAPTPCGECQSLDDGTLALTGEVSLARLSQLEGGRPGAELGGMATTARFDEARVDPGLLGLGALPAAVAGVAAVAVAWKLLALFSRALRDPLANARRREVYQAILANPGLAFRDLLRLTGLANGVALHHVRTLVRHGLIARHAVGNTLRLFENHGRYDKDWRTVAALRDDEARLLHAWLKARGRCRQLDAIAAARDWGWSPTATKRRLAGLVEAGLAASARHGRVRWYEAAASPG